MEDPVYSFSEVVDRIDLRKYFVEKESKVGRPRYDGVKMLKIILFAFMENGYASVRKMSKLCKTDIRYMWLLDGMKAPSFMKISQFIQEEQIVFHGRGKLKRMQISIAGYGRTRV